MIIRGANILEKNVEYNRLSNYNWTDNPRLIKIINNIETMYNDIKTKAKEQNIKFLKTTDGNVILPVHALNHRCTNSIENLREISKHGILASEWFGELESEREACFCTFLSRMKGDDYPYHGDLAEDDRSRLNIGNNIILFFDDTNNIMKYLLHLDYFEFEHQKQINPNYKSLYTEDELKMLEELIEPLSPAGMDMRRDYNSKTNYWSAIPGGVPSELINGVCIKNNDYTDDELNEINTLFPNAVIFDSNKKVVRYPLINKNDLDEMFNIENENNRNSIKK